MFRKLWLDVILATIFVFGIMGFFSSLTAFKIFDIFDPIADALGDFQITDIVFSQLREDPVADERVVLINIGTEGRGSIAYMIDQINQYNPAVIGVDTFFDFPKEDTLADMYLSEVLGSVENLVMVNQVLLYDDDDVADSVRYSYPLFTWNAEFAHANLDAIAEDQEDLKFCRQFWPMRKDQEGTEHVAFGVKLASYLDSANAQKFLERGNSEELINFVGNVIDFGATKYGNKYYALDVPDVQQGNFIPEIIEGKIVIFCYLGDYLGDRSSAEDKYITPLNANYAGRAFPDMYGGVIHANIISMILNDQPVNIMRGDLQTALAIILCFLNVLLFSIIYKRIPKWYDGMTKVFQLVEVIFFYFLMLQVMDLYNYYMDLKLALVAIALSGDSLEVYYGVVKNTFTKEGRRSLFKADKL